MRANAFAAELLLPREAVLGASSGGRLSLVATTELTRRYDVSKWVVRHQAENQELLVSPASSRRATRGDRERARAARR